MGSRVLAGSAGFVDKRMALEVGIPGNTSLRIETLHRSSNRNSFSFFCVWAPESRISPLRVMVQAGKTSGSLAGVSAPGHSRAAPCAELLVRA